MDERFKELDAFLDQAISDVLQETTRKPREGSDSPKDPSGWKDSDRSRGFDSKVKDEASYGMYERPLTNEEIKRFREYEASKSDGTSHHKKSDTDSQPWEYKNKYYSNEEKPGERQSDEASRSESINQHDQSPTSYKPRYYRRPEPTNITPKPEEFITYKDYIKSQETEPSKQSHDIYKNLNSENNFYSTDSSQANKRHDDLKSHFLNPYSRSAQKPSQYRSNTLNKDYTSEVTKQNNSESYPTSKDFTSAENKYYSSGHSQIEQSPSEKSHYEKSQQSAAEEKPSHYKSYIDIYPDESKERYKDSRNTESKQDIKAQDESSAKDMTLEEHVEEVKRELLKLRPEIKNRVSWGALPPMGKLQEMVPPADTLVFTFNTGTPSCLSEKECKRTVREIQARHMGEGLADIQYNFLVGGDGNLYEGRGWGYESGVKPVGLEGKNYNIAFIGSHKGKGEDVPQHMLLPVQDLIIWGNAIKLISKSANSIGEYIGTKEN